MPERNRLNFERHIFITMAHEVNFTSGGCKSEGALLFLNTAIHVANDSVANGVQYIMRGAACLLAFL